MAVLLAIDPSTREVGWAVFVNDDLDGAREPPAPSSTPRVRDDRGQQTHPGWELVETGITIAHDRPWRVEVSERIKAIEQALDDIARAWLAHDAACGKPSVLHLPQQQEGNEKLSKALERWAACHNLPLFSYPLREIRTAILGRSKSAKEELAYATMTRWGLLGIVKSIHEWNAIAVGDHYLGCRRAEATVGV